MRFFARNNLMQLVTTGGFIASLNFVYGQSEMKTIQSTPPNNRVATLQALEIAASLPAESVPSWEDLCSAQFPVWTASSGNPNSVAVRNLGDGARLAEGLDVSAALPPVHGSGRFLPPATNTPGTDDLPTNSYPLNGSWLDASGETNGIPSFNLHDSQTGAVYEVWSESGLKIPEWRIEQEAWLATNREGLLHTIPVVGPVNLLLLWQRDSIGNFGLFFTAATTNSGSVYSARIGVSHGQGSCGGAPFIIQGGVSF